MRGCLGFAWEQTSFGSTFDAEEVTTTCASRFTEQVKYIPFTPYPNSTLLIHNPLQSVNLFYYVGILFVSYVAPGTHILGADPI